MKNTLILFIFFLLFSNSNITFSQTTPVDHWETIIYTDTIWSYFEGDYEPDTNWRELSFNDSLWLQGPGGIGYGDGDDNTVIGKIISVFLRVKFNIADTASIQKLLLHVDYDDAFVAYLNNVEIARDNIGTPGIIPPYNQGADSYHEAQMYQGGLPDEFLLKKNDFKDLLLNGENVLAIQVHNASSNSPDMSSIAFLSVGINDTTFTYLPTPPWFVPPFEFVSSNLPIVVLNTQGQTIPDDPKIDIEMGIINNGPGQINYFTDPFTDYNGMIGIERRGSSSQMFPKKSYSLETRDSLGNNNNVALFGMPKENDWILYAPYSDKSLLRNVITYKLGNNFGNYTPRTQMCELVMNGEYWGVYVFMEKIKRDKNRVDISKLEPHEIAGDSLTGGYILKIDKLTGNSSVGWYSPYAPYNGSPMDIMFQFEYPDHDEIVTEQEAYIQNQITSFESVLDGTNFDDPVIGYKSLIDVGSFIDFMIVNELTKNVDGYRLSSFLYKDKNSNGGDIHMGPLWDFNLGFGNADYCGGDSYSGWAYDFNYVCPGDANIVPFWWERLLEDINFQNQLKCRWEEVRSGPLHLDTLMNYINSMAIYLDESQQRNFSRWKVLGQYIWPNNFVGQTYPEEIDYLKDWITDRLSWLDINMPGVCNTTSVDGDGLSDEALVYIFPNPASDVIYFRQELRGNQITLKLFDNMGREVKSLQTASRNIITLHLNNLNPGIYFYTLLTENGKKAAGKVVVR